MGASASIGWAVKNFGERVLLKTRYRGNKLLADALPTMSSHSASPVSTQMLISYTHFTTQTNIVCLLLSTQAVQSIYLLKYITSIDRLDIF